MSRFIPNEPDRVEQTGVVFKEIFYEPGEMQRAALAMLLEQIQLLKQIRDALK